MQGDLYRPTTMRTLGGVASIGQQFRQCYSHRICDVLKALYCRIAIKEHRHRRLGDADSSESVGHLLRQLCQRETFALDIAFYYGKCITHMV